MPTYTGYSDAQLASASNDALAAMQGMHGMPNFPASPQYQAEKAKLDAINAEIARRAGNGLDIVGAVDSVVNPVAKVFDGMVKGIETALGVSAAVAFTGIAIAGFIAWEMRKK